MHNIQIDSEFQALIPPLSAEERAQLEANIVADGCRDPLVVWGDTLIDGHNRYEICTRLGLPFEVVQKSLDGRPQARMWIRSNQYGRRNLSSFVRAELALGDKADIAEIAKSQQGKRNDISPTLAEGFKPVDTREEVSKRAGISHGSLDKVEAIKASNPQPEILSAVRSGEVSINLAAQFVDLPQEVQQEAIAAIAEHSEPAKEVMREAVHNHRAQGTGENEWYTPQQHIDAVYAVLGGIDLDPASSEIANKTVQADRIFTIEDDGLSKTWAGRVWMNPPYAQPHIANFVEKLASEYEAGNVSEAIALTHNYTDTQWFHRAALSCNAICFTRGRIGFLSPEGKRAAPTQGQAFFYYGHNTPAFLEAFCAIGFVVEVRNAS